MSFFWLVEAKSYFLHLRVCYSIFGVNVVSSQDHEGPNGFSVNVRVHVPEK